ncbi:syncytin-1-like [Betta splendens]|uniref:Syncytin-1-like n=1 Tax=Betta splendens TaxID=158456 RepID=A0A9W2XAC9_BETSP|nr:syncytin-1-like [Betta splendens]
MRGHCPAMGVVLTALVLLIDARPLPDLIQDEERPPDQYHTNSWYRYMKFLAKQSTHNFTESGCYVCGNMPKSVANPDVQIQPVDPQREQLYPDTLRSLVSPDAFYASFRGQTKGLVPRPPPYQGRNYTRFLSANFSTDILFDHVPFPPQFKGHCFQSSSFSLLKNKDLAISVGEVPLKHCQTVKMPCTRSATHFNTSEAPKGVQCVPYYDGPDFMGTLPQSDINYVCGHTIYVHLPPNWVGRCAPVYVSDGSYVITPQQMTHKGRLRKREMDLKESDRIWGSDVPMDKKLWTTGQKVALSLFPWLGDRLVLDLLTASQGGVCAIVGPKCCTYIPGDDQDAKVTQQALRDLQHISNVQAADVVKDKSWFDWFRSGTWTDILMKIFGPILLILLVLMLIVLCVIPCLRAMIIRLVNQGVLRVCAVMHSRQILYTPLKLDNCEEDLHDVDGNGR